MVLHSQWLDVTPIPKTGHAKQEPFLGMTDPRVDFVPADLMAQGEIGLFVVHWQLSAVLLFWALPVFTCIVVRSFGMDE